MNAPAKIGWGGIAALALGAVAVAVVLVQLAGVAQTLLVPAAGESASKQDERLAEAAEKYAATVDENVAQISGRSLFFVPGAPPPPPPPPRQETEPGPPPPPSKPSSYAGPALIAMVNDTVWFADGTRLKAGGEPEHDLKVVALEAPWGAKVEWKGVEFSVSLFDRDKVVVKPDGSDAQKHDEAAEADPDTRKDDPASPSAPKPPEAQPQAKPADVKPGEQPPPQPGQDPPPAKDGPGQDGPAQDGPGREDAPPPASDPKGGSPSAARGRPWFISELAARSAPASDALSSRQPHAPAASL